MVDAGPQLLDHVLAAVFAIGFPLVATPLYARRRPALRAGDTDTRRPEYGETILWLGGMGLATLALWTASGRPLAVLGLGLPRDWQSIVGIAVATAGGALLFVQVRAVSRDEHAREATRRSLEHVREYLPAGPEEWRLFRAVSISAGLGEELFYRGFLLWYLTQFTTLVWAVALSSILFGVAHAMHGTGATIRAAVTGALLAGLYLFSGALWASMLWHATIDLSSGKMGLAVFEPGADD